MTVLQCKMCGGSLTFTGDGTTATCDFCGALQTIPKADDEKKLLLFERAERLRKQCEFDKAAGIYESIIADFHREAEAYWGLVLCKYGIEYVDDPATGKKVPTCHRSGFDNVLRDPDLEQALENAEPIARRLYREEAKQFEELRKGIISVSANEDPYDIFICYKETAPGGGRTLDSVLAQDIYDALTAKGYRVFFSRISLEDKLGQAYEPYIFAALHSAKVMLAVGTDYEYYDAVWVKNEWSRFLKLMAVDKSKSLIPCYKNISIDDMPAEFTHLQALDLGRIGALQDLLRGIEKLLPLQAATTVVHETVTITESTAVSGTNPAATLERAFIFLEEGNFLKARLYLEKVLDADPKNGQAYLGKLMADLSVRTPGLLKDQRLPFDHNPNYQKAIRFGDEKLKAELSGYTDHIQTRVEADRLESTYEKASGLLENAKSPSACAEAIRLFESIPDYKDAGEKAELCLQKMETLQEAKVARRKKAKATGRKVGRITLIVTCILVVLVILAAVVFEFIIPTIRYNKATRLMEEGRYEEAAARFIELHERDEADKCRYLYAIQLMEAKDYDEAIRYFKYAAPYEDSAEKILECRYRQAETLLGNGAYDEAIEAFTDLGGYKDSETRILDCRYSEAVATMEAGLYPEAIEMFTALDGYKDSYEKINACNAGILDPQYEEAVSMMEAGLYTEAIEAFEALNGYRDSSEKIAQCNTAILDKKYNDAVAMMNAGLYSEAIQVFTALDGYKDSKSKISACNTAIKDKSYNSALSLMRSGKYKEAIDAFKALNGYKDSAQQIQTAKLQILKTAKVGDIVTFGTYEQDNNTGNGKEEIEWIVLEVKGDRILVVSQKILDERPYHTSDAYVTWATCNLRSWLNQEFLNSAFSSAERARIPTVTVSADKNPDYDTLPGSSTQDQVFPLSILEAEKYFSSNSSRASTATTYARKQGVISWWTRTPGRNTKSAAYVHASGSIAEIGHAVSSADGVRPAMWIDLGD